MEAMEGREERPVANALPSLSRFHHLVTQMGMEAIEGPALAYALPSLSPQFLTAPLPPKTKAPNCPGHRDGRALL